MHVLCQYLILVTVDSDEPLEVNAVPPTSSGGNLSSAESAGADEMAFEMEDFQVKFQHTFPCC